MRLAVLADIHGNVLALDAVLDDLARRDGADRVVNLGDCVSGPLWPRETMARLEALGPLTVRGNHDRWVATLDPAAMSASDRFACDRLSADQRASLGAMPMTLAVAQGVVAFHARPGSDEENLIEDVAADGRMVRAGPGTVAARLGDRGGLSDLHAARVLLCGHSHRPDLVLLEDGTLVLNPGSVGCPAFNAGTYVSEAGTPHARYALLDLEDGAEAEVAFLAVRYDHEAAARQAEAAGQPAWADALRTGQVGRAGAW